MTSNGDTALKARDLMNRQSRQRRSDAVCARAATRRPSPAIGGRRALILVLWVLAVLLVPGRLPEAFAQASDDAASGASYITPFPGGERYRLRIIGDEFGDGMQVALAESLGSDPRLDIEKKHVWLSGLTRPDSENELKAIAEGIAREKPHLAVVMFGSMDRWSYRTPDGRRHGAGSPEWRQVYTKRTDQLIRSLKSAGVAIYWVGLPIMRRSETNESALVQNEVFRERTYLSGVRFIDVHQSFADEQGEYNPYGPDIAGKSRLLRDSDGMHMTVAGYQKLAHFVERELKRDLSQAKNERAIPLAGNEAEQALINPGQRTRAANGNDPGGTSAADIAQGGSMAGNGGAAGEQPADSSRINLKMAAADGSDRIEPIEILRPAIPAAVIALVTRRESPDKASQMGDQVIDQIPGGLTVMSSITPGGDASAGGGTRRKTAPTQTPYFRVLVKGERIMARPGRADDVSWPRPEVDQRADAPTQNSPEVVPNAAREPEASIPPPVAKPRR